MPETHGPRWTLHHGDCLDVMKRMDAGSVDAVVCDPPYGLGFMGKAWDSDFAPGDSPMRRTAERDAVNAGAARQGGRQRACADYGKRMARDSRNFQAWCEGWAIEALRVAKPGAHLLAFGGTRTFHRLTCAIEDAGWEVRDCLSWIYGSGFPKSHNLDGAHEGWGTALKPAWEPVILARKPLVGTVAANVAAHGTGALNIDATRIGTAEITTLSTPGVNKFPSAYAGDMIAKHGDETHIGRWPANVALDESAAAMLDRQSGLSESNPNPNPNPNPNYQNEVYGRGMGGVVSEENQHADFGGASRFFYTAKASRSEREAGLAGREREQVTDGRAVPPDNAYQRGATMRANTHPTVKPVDLMRWLVRLVCPIGATCLDPFTGSGTTGVACIEEGVHFVGIEKEPAYVEIARKRLTHAQAQGRLDFSTP